MTSHLRAGNKRCHPERDSFARRTYRNSRRTAQVLRFAQNDKVELKQESLDGTAEAVPFPIVRRQLTS